MIKKLSLLAGLVLALPTLAIAASGGIPAPGKAIARADAEPEAPPETIVTPRLAGNYAFATTTSGSLADMSSGTTTLLVANVDDTASPLTSIGFDFWFQGTRHTQFSVNENGSLRLGALAQTGAPYQSLAQANLPIISAYAADQRTHTGDGKVHFRVEGSAPSRKLIVEWLNTQSNFNTGGTADLTYQVQLSETTGAIEFVYGSMNMSSAGAAAADSNDPQIGFSSSNTAGNVGSVAAPRSGTPAPTFNGSSSTPTNNLYNAAGAITVLTSAANGSRRTFSFTPPAVAPPTAMNFSTVTPVSMDVNWTDAGGESSYQVLRSTDGVNFTLAGTVPANTTTFNAQGLTPVTNYFWQVVALFELGASPPLSGSQATGAGGAVSSNAAGGNWSDPATWAGGSVPGAFDNVTIVAGAPVVIDTAAVGLSLTIDSSAVLRWDASAPRSLAIGASVINDGIFETPSSGSVTTHSLRVGISLTNNNTLDFSTNGDTAGAEIVFNAPNDSSFGGSGAITDVRSIVLNKGSSSVNTLELNPANFTVQGVATDNAGFLTLTNGTLKISGTFLMFNRVFTAAAYAIPATAGIWLNNPNFTLTPQNASATCNGRFRVSQGEYYIGTASGNSMTFSAGSQITLEGGNVRVAGRFGVAAAATVISYAQTGGTLTAATEGNATTTLASFDLGTSTGSSVTISGGSIVLQLANTAASGPRDYRNQAGAGGAGVTGGTLQLGNGGSITSRTFVVNGVVPDLVIDNSAGGHIVSFGAPVTYNNFSRNITINSGTSLILGANTFLFNGTTITNNGSLSSTGTGARFIVFRPATNVRYQGSGTVVAPMTSLELQNDLNLTFDPAVSNVTVGRLILFNGNIVNANKLTLGNGGTTTNILQFGNTDTPTAGGSLDVAPVFNLGSGGQVVSYLRTTNSQSTGMEINPLRTLASLSYDNNNPGHALNLSGGDLTVTGTLALTNGRVLTGNASLIAGATATVTRSTGYVDGTLGKTFSAAASRSFEVGSANGFSPVTLNTTAASFPALAKVRAIGARAPLILPADKAINRHWQIDAPGFTADVTLNYLDPLDIPVTVTEANLRLYVGTPYTELAATLNTGANSATVTGQTQFGRFTLAETGATTAVPDLSISKTDDKTTIDTGSANTYTIVVSNTGTAPVNGALITDTPGPDLTCATWTCVASPGATCGVNPVSGPIDDQAGLPVGAFVTYTQQCTVATTSTAARISNVASVALPVGMTDANPADNTATDNTDLVRLSNLSVSKTDGVSTVSPGGSVVYTIVVGNTGPNSAAVTTTDTFPASLQSCSWTCAAVSGTCTASGSGNLADIGSLASGGTLTYTASCSVAPAASGSISNTASVAVGAGERDTDLANNSATDTDTVVALPDVAVTISDGRQFVRVGESLNYIITVTNSSSPQTATPTLSSVLPVELSGGSWTCVPFGGATCAGGSGNTLSDTPVLPSGSQVAYVYSATVQPGSPDDIITTTATATLAGDPNPANNSATDTPADTIIVFKDGFDGTVLTLLPAGADHADGYASAKLRVDPTLLSGLGLQPVTVAVGYSEQGAELFALELARFNTQVVLRSVVRDSNGLSERGAWFAIDPARAAIDFAWQAASADANDGYLRVGGGAAPQIHAGRSDRGRLANLRVATQQNVPWVSLIGN